MVWGCKISQDSGSYGFRLGLGCRVWAFKPETHIYIVIARP